MSKINLTIVATINPNGKEELSHYLEKIGELYKQAKAKPVNKFMVTKVLIGHNKPSFVSTIEFPNMNALNGVFDSEEYKKIVPYRENAFLKLEAYISE